MEDSIAIIGGGIAGLAAGCYGRMNGYATKIFELHDKPGGLCTSWKRKGYTFDGCLHWLVGTRPGSGFNAIWRELGALRDTEIVNHDVFTRLEAEDGRARLLLEDAAFGVLDVEDVHQRDRRRVRIHLHGGHRLVRYLEREVRPGCPLKKKDPTPGS